MDSKAKKVVSKAIIYTLLLLLAYKVIIIIIALFLGEFPVPVPKDFIRSSRVPDHISPCVWESTDGTIKFTVGEWKTFYEPSKEPYEDMYTYGIESNMYGEINLSDGTVCKFFILYDDDWNLRLFNSETKEFRFSDLDENNVFVYFNAKYRRRDRFYAEVIDGTLFEKGTKFEFHRTLL